MFDKLKGGLDAVKGKMDSGAMAPIIDKITPHVQPHLDKVLGMSADHVQDDEKYKTNIVSPAVLAIHGSSSGATALIPRFDERFTIAMFHVRNELVICDQGKVGLAADCKSRLPSVLEEAFKKSA